MNLCKHSLLRAPVSTVLCNLFTDPYRSASTGSVQEFKRWK